MVSGPALGRREKAERKKGWRWQEVQDPFLMGTSADPTWSLPGVGAGAGQPGLGPLSRVHPHLAPGWPQSCPHSHLRGLYLFHSPSSATSLGRGWTLGLYRINTNPDGAGLFASDPPLLTPSCPLDHKGGWATGFICIPFVGHYSSQQRCGLGLLSPLHRWETEAQRSILLKATL